MAPAAAWQQRRTAACWSRPPPTSTSLSPLPRWCIGGAHTRAMLPTPCSGRQGRQARAAASRGARRPHRHSVLLPARAAGELPSRLPVALAGPGLRKGCWLRHQLFLALPPVGDATPHRPALAASPQPSAEQAQVYQAVPAGPQYVAPPPEPSFWGKIPPLVYIGVGACQLQPGCRRCVALLQCRHGPPARLRRAHRAGCGSAAAGVAQRPLIPIPLNCCRRGAGGCAGQGDGAGEGRPPEDAGAELPARARCGRPRQRSTTAHRRCCRPAVPSRRCSVRAWGQPRTSLLRCCRRLRCSR